MLRICSGRTNREKDRFLYDGIRADLAAIRQKGAGRVLLIVPDQYTLQAERNAFDYLNVSGLMDLEVLSPARLGEKILAGTGRSAHTPLDKYGRHMLLSRIIAEEAPSFQAYGGMTRDQAFIGMMNDLISEFKQFNTAPGAIADMLTGLDAHAMLARKLSDILRVYDRYETLIKDKYIDTEDHLALVIASLPRYTPLRGADVWIDGFDYFTPKNLAMIEQLAVTAGRVHVLLTGGGNGRDDDLFTLSDAMRQRLRTIAEKNGIRTEEIDIREEEEPGARTESDGQHPAIRHLSRELYAYPYRRFDGQTEAIEICRCVSSQAEAETAAARIVELARTEGLRYRDMLVICNDMEGRGSIIRRVFDEYGIPCFIDQKRGIIHNPCIEYILALLDIIGRGWQTEDILRLIKTGFSPIKADQCEDLENYAYIYRIRGRKWRSPFRYGAPDLGEEGLARVEAARSVIAALAGDFERLYNEQETAADKAITLYRFLKEQAAIPAQAEKMTEDLRALGRHDYAEETAQVWQVIVGLLEQVAALSGDEPMTPEAFSAMLRTGFEAVEIGLLPPTMDQVLVGALQRTRPGAIRALFVIGVNDGILPAASLQEGLLNEDEKARLMGDRLEICKYGELKIQEEKLAVFRILSRPAARIWISYAAADQDGKEQKASPLIGKIRRLFPDLRESKDIISAGEALPLIGNRRSTLRHLAGALRQGFEGGGPEDAWKAAYRWYLERVRQGSDLAETAMIQNRLRSIRAGLTFDNRAEKLDAELVRSLYGRGAERDVTLSPSRVERFSKCPFAYFVGYGLRADERRPFEIAGREIGDISHECLMKLGMELSVDGIGITDPASPWMTISREACDGLVDRVLLESAEAYREGVFVSGAAELYRRERVRRICRKTAWMLIEHVRKGRIGAMLFETSFGSAPTDRLPPVRIETDSGLVLIEGKIDRIDILSGERSWHKIIDYKSGAERFNADEARAGWRLQLMLYLKAATGGLSSAPAGVFYFYINDPMVDAAIPREGSPDAIEAASAELAAQLRKKYRMDGVLVDDPDVIRGIDDGFEGQSDIVPVRRTGDGAWSGSESRLFSAEAFERFQDDVDRTVRTLCDRLLRGHIDIKPKKLKNTSACAYCAFRSICNFDLSFDGNQYDPIG